MPRLTFVDREGVEHTVEEEAGLTVMEIIRETGFVDDPFAICGGCCSCSTCHVHVDEAWREKVGPPGADEAELLDTSDFRKENSRLSCQILFTEELDGLRVTVAEAD